MITNIRSLMIGTCLSNKGGITTVLNLYNEAGFMEDVRFLASSKDGESGMKIQMYLTFLGQLLTALILHPEIRLAHMHVSQRGSFVRKSVAFLICKLFGKKVIWHMHGSEFIDFYQSAPPLYQRYIHGIVTRLDCLIALSQKRRRELLAIIPEARVKVVYNPSRLQDGAQISAHRAVAAQRTPSTEAPVRFLFMGRYGQRKGVYDLIEAVKLLNDPRLQVSLYGDVEVEPVKAAVHAANLDHQIHVHTWISGEDKHRTFLNSHVLLLPSYNEGLPMAILEALSYAMPVISTPVGGIPEAVLDGETGFLVEPGDVQALAERMRRFLEDPSLIQTMGQAGYQLAAEQFELSRVMSDLSHLYEELSTPPAILVTAQ